MFFLNLVFWHESLLYADCWLYVLNMLLGSGIHMHITRTHYQPKNGHIWLKNVLSEFNFQNEVHLYANCSFDILTMYPKYHLFQFFSRDIRMYIPIQTGVQNGRISLQKNSKILLKYFLFKALFQRWMSPVFKFLVLYSDYVS